MRAPAACEISFVVSAGRSRTIIQPNNDSCLVPPRPADRLQLRADDGAGLPGGRLRYPPRMHPPRPRPRVFVVDRNRRRRDGAHRFAPLRDSRRPADLPRRSQVDDLFRLGLRVLRRHDRRNARRLLRFALVSNRVRRDDGHVRAWRSRSDRQSDASDASWRATATGACRPPCRGRWPIRTR